MNRIKKYHVGDTVKNCLIIKELDTINGKRYIEAKCHCGVIFSCVLYNLTKGKRSSCGCVYKSSRKTCNFIHGNALKGVNKKHEETTEYRTWLGMKQRCGNPDNDAYKDYGGRGIFIDESWEGSFVNFLKDMGKKPSISHTLERMDNNKGYSKDNCYWATAIEQANNRRNNIVIVYKGKSKTLKQWADELGLNYKNIHKRIVYRGWSIEDAFTLGAQHGSRYVSKRKVA